MTSSVTQLSSFDHPIYDPSYAFCGDCELLSQCDAGKWVTSEVGQKYQPGGLMLLGEGPGRTEVSQRRPFVGAAGRMLDALLESASITRDEVILANTTLCLPTAKSARDETASLHERFPNAIPACLPRLQAEIGYHQPRVIVALGVPALVALTGRDVIAERIVDFACTNERCRHVVGKPRFVYPAIVCANGKCGWWTLAPPELERLSDGTQAPSNSVAILEWRAEVMAKTNGMCPKCKSSITCLRPRTAVCPKCHGKKKRREKYNSFLAPKIALIGRNGVAGAVFSGAELPDWLREAGVKYVIPTYHPSFCMRAFRGGGASSADYRIGGQFAARASVTHLEKASSLLRRDAVFVAKPLITKDPNVVEAYFADGGDFTCDVETDNREGPWKSKRITCIGFARADREDALVIDTWDLAEWWTLSEGSREARLLDAIHRALTDPMIGKIFHNGIFDCTVIRRLWGIEVVNIVCDTLIAHNNCYPDEEHNLSFLAHELTDSPSWKDSRHTVRDGESHRFSGYPTFEDLALYNAKDNRATALVDQSLRGADGTHGLIAVDGVPDAFAVDMKMLKIAIDMQWNGLPFCLETRAHMRKDIVEQRNGSLSRMRGIVGDNWLERYVATGAKLSKALRDDPTFNPSGAALLWALYHPEGPNGLTAPAFTAKRSKKWPNGQPTVSKKHLHKLKHIPFVADYIIYKKNDHYLSHYFDSDELTPWVDGRIHPEWKPWGARTGRWCLAPGTRVLTSDLRWVPIETLKVDDELVGFPERFESGKGRHEHNFERAKVTETSIITRPCFRVTTDRGTVVASDEHLWVVGAMAGKKCSRRWVTTNSLRVGDALVYYVDPWETDTDYDAGYLRGLLDGEGWISKGYLAFGQKPGVVYDRYVELLTKKGIHFVEDRSGSDGCWRVRTCSKDALHLVGSVRPDRLLQRSALLWEGQRTYGKRTVTAKILEIEFLGEQEVVAIGTSTKTLIAEGFLTHNSSSPNFQNWPRILRQLVRVRKGRKIVGADASQIEFRISAVLANAPELIRRCAEADAKRKYDPDHDPHSFMSYLVYGETYTALDLNDPKQREQRHVLRDIVKRVVYGLNYGGGAETVHEAIYAGGYSGPPITVNDVRRVIEIYFRAFPEIPIWRNRALDEAARTREARSAILGRHRVFPLGQIDATIVWNFPIQSTASDIMNLQLIELDSVIREVDPTALLIAQVHDAIYVECDEKRVVEVAQCMQAVLSSERTLIEGGLSMPFPFDVHVADNWYEAS